MCGKHFGFRGCLRRVSAGVTRRFGCLAIIFLATSKPSKSSKTEHDIIGSQWFSFQTLKKQRCPQRHTPRAKTRRAEHNKKRVHMKHRCTRAMRRHTRKVYARYPQGVRDHGKTIYFLVLAPNEHRPKRYTPRAYPFFFR